MRALYHFLPKAAANGLLNGVLAGAGGALGFRGAGGRGADGGFGPDGFGPDGGFGADDAAAAGAVACLIDSPMRFRCASTVSTRTFTRSPTLTTSAGSLTNRCASSE